MQKITTFLWFDTQALEAAKFYCAIFKKSRVLSSFGSDGKGNPLGVRFSLGGQHYQAINGGPIFKFNESISLYINCKDQKEVDYYWIRLCKGGQPSQCGWLKDKYGLSWQVVPRALEECLWGKDKAGSARAMQAMLKMAKLDVKKLKAAYRG
jgi:predicted 3-demethylubiquinone-9 3-methyltransferase (glyoxalase superfamily)